MGSRFLCHFGGLEFEHQSQLVVQSSTNPHEPWYIEYLGCACRPLDSHQIGNPSFPGSRIHHFRNSGSLQLDLLLNFKITPKRDSEPTIPNQTKNEHLGETTHFFGVWSFECLTIFGPGGALASSLGRPVSHMLPCRGIALIQLGSRAPHCTLASAITAYVGAWKVAGETSWDCSWATKKNPDTTFHEILVGFFRDPYFMVYEIIPI